MLVDDDLTEVHSPLYSYGRELKGPSTRVPAAAGEPGRTQPYMLVG